MFDSLHAVWYKYYHFDAFSVFDQNEFECRAYFSMLSGTSDCFGFI